VISAPTNALGRSQETRILTESDLLRLIVNCALPAAVEFEHLVRRHRSNGTK
jgi:prophage antirepressor-like protein